MKESCDLVNVSLAQIFHGSERQHLDLHRLHKHLFDKIRVCQKKEKEVERLRERERERERESV